MGRKVRCAEMKDDSRGYVIRCHDLLDGSTDFRGQKGVFARTKAGLTAGDTYTLSGAKRTLANMRRLCFDSDRYQYSIERLDEYYVSLIDPADRDTDAMRMGKSVDDAMKRLDELWDGNDFDNGDKMRITEIRNVLRMLKGNL